MGVLGGIGTEVSHFPRFHTFLSLRLTPSLLRPFIVPRQAGSSCWYKRGVHTFPALGRLSAHGRPC